MPSLEALLTLSPLPRKSSPGTKEDESIFKCEDCNEIKLGGKVAKAGFSVSPEMDSSIMISHFLNTDSKCDVSPPFFFLPSFFFLGVIRVRCQIIEWDILLKKLCMA